MNWTKHADWQPKPRNLNKILPICPICREEASWEIHDNWGVAVRKGYRYKAICNKCKAEWGCVPVNPWSASNLLGILSPNAREIFSFPNEDSKMMLQSIGGSPKGDASSLLNKELPLKDWKAIARSEIIYCTNCGAEINKNSAFCKKCGVKVE